MTDHDERMRKLADEGLGSTEDVRRRIARIKPDYSWYPPADDEPETVQFLGINYAVVNDGEVIDAYSGVLRCPLCTKSTKKTSPNWSG